jgi:2-dehydro-3-deoxygalactonokinase
LSGELYSLLCRHSVLFAGFAANVDDDAFDETAFDAGIDEIRANANSLSHSLFNVRSRQVAGTFTAAQARNFLSGLIIGSDVRAALAAYPGVGNDIAIIGGPKQTGLYARAIATLHRSSNPMDGIDAAMQGYRAIGEAWSS